MSKAKLLHIIILTISLLVATSQAAIAYLDPGIGSYYFQVLIAALVGGVFAIKTFWQKIKTFFSDTFSKKQNPDL